MCYRVISGTERGMLMNRGTVVEQSRSINFLQQRKDAMQTWWEYAIGIKQHPLPKHPLVQVVQHYDHTILFARTFPVLLRAIV